ncbi:MAG: TonB-dependent receptor [Pseudomonadota bacterium]
MKNKQSVRYPCWLPRCTANSIVALVYSSFLTPVVAADLKLSAQPLDQAITQIASQSGQQIVLYSDDAAGIRAPELSGEFTAEQALDRILSGTGLIYRRINNRTIAVAPPERLQLSQFTPPIRSGRQQRAQGFQGDALLANAEIEEDANFLETIFVTSLKRSDDLQNVPASISVFTPAKLEAFQLDSIRDISRLTPNFLGSSFTNTQPIFAIRGGANTLSAIGTSEPVGVYVDEVYLPRFSSADFELFDLESVEVLRGPQGTFFGRNVASGAIVLTSAKPSVDVLKVKAQAGYGNFNAYELRGLISGPVSDTLAAKISVSQVERDGFGRDAITGQDQDNRQSTSVRTAALWHPNSAFEAILAFDYTSDSNGGRTLSAIGFGSEDRRTSDLGVPQNFERDIFGASLRLSYDAGHGAFLSISGYRESSSEELFSFNGLSFTLLPFAFQQVDEDFEDPRTFSQELRYVSADNDQYSFIAGLFYLYENSDRRVERNRFLNGAGIVIQDIIFDQNIKTNAFAAYVDGTYHLSDKIDISAGIRYTYEDRTAMLNFIDNGNAARSFQTGELQESFDAFTPRAALTYRPGDDVTLFASVSRGFTAGGFNTEADSLVEITTPFDEETILSFEGGLKARFADRRGYANLVYFYQQYDNKQEFVFDTATFLGTILNAADATIQGVEIEAGFKLNDYFSVDANYGFLDTQFDRFPLGANNPEGNTGNELGNSPNNQFAITASGQYPVLGGAADAFANISFSWTDSYFAGASNDPDLVIESYSLLGASIGIRTEDGRWAAELYGQNLTNEDFVLIPSDFIVQAEYLGAPRTYGARVTFAY